MTIIEKENYRLCTIRKLVNAQSFEYEEKPVKNGLAIEKKCEDDNSWYVIAFIKYDDKEPCCANCGAKMDEAVCDEEASTK